MNYNPLSYIIRHLRPKQPLTVARVELAKQAEKNSKDQLPLDRRTPYRIDLTMDNREAAIQAARNVMHPRRKMLYDLYLMVMEDEHLSSQVQTRILKTLSQRFVIIKEGGKVGSRFDDNMAKLFRKPWFYEFMNMSLETKFWGHSLIQFFPGTKNPIDKVELVHREHVRPETGEILRNPSDSEGWEYRKEPLNKFLLEIGKTDDLGLLLKASRAVILKRYTLTDWARRSEKYGQPLLVVKSHTDDQKELQKKAEWAAGFGSNSWMILDKEDEVEFKESNQAFTWQIFDGLSERMDKYLSKLIAGQTMTADNGSSLAQAEVHENILDDIVTADMRWLAFQVNECLFPFLENFGMSFKGLRWEFYQNTEEWEQEQQAKAEKKKLNLRTLTGL